MTVFDKQAHDRFYALVEKPKIYKKPCLLCGKVQTFRTKGKRMCSLCEIKLKRAPARAEGVS